MLSRRRRYQRYLGTDHTGRDNASWATDREPRADPSASRLLRPHLWHKHRRVTQTISQSRLFMSTSADIRTASSPSYWDASGCQCLKLSTSIDFSRSTCSRIRNHQERMAHSRLRSWKRQSRMSWKQNWVPAARRKRCLCQKLIVKPARRECPSTVHQR